MPVDTFTKKCQNKEKEITMKRSNVKKSQSKKTFKKGMRTNAKNVQPTPQRGGYRL